MISHKYKFIFIHINKTAGTSIEAILNNYAENFKIKHQPINALNKEAIDNSYFKFTFVRNSWDRFLSLYKYRVKTNQTNLGNKTICFKDWAKKIHHKDPFYYNNTCQMKNLMLSEQVDWITDETKTINMNFIGRFENLQNDFNLVCDKIGISRQQLPHTNKTNHKHYTEYYDDETREIVAEKYARDIEYFGYKFGD